MNIVFIIPTGIGCEIGGHAGDATPSAKLIASVCDKLIIHPNVVNASNFNEMTDNMLYVEGSILDKFLSGIVNLKYSTGNKILLVANTPIKPDLINTISVARSVLGIEVEVLELKTPLLMKGWVDNNVATGDYSGVLELVEQISTKNYDALAVVSEIQVDDDVALNYFRNGGVNPWGGIEAKVSKSIAIKTNKPVAHAPFDNQATLDNMEMLLLPYTDVVDPRMSAEVLSTTYTYCLFKGLYKAPLVLQDNEKDYDLTYKNIDYLISPYGCIGKPHKICMDKEIPIIVVKENKTVLDQGIPENAIVLENYIEVAGFLSAKKAGVSIESVRRPIRSEIY